MARLSTEARKERLNKLLRLCLRRSKGDSSEDQMAKELGFVDAVGVPSARVMYERLQEWGLPDWVVYPDDAAIEHTEKTTPERKARSTGNVQELPAAGRAVDLFREDLERLTYYLNQLPGLKEQLQAERFVSSYWVGEDWEYYYKSDFSEQGWKELCEELGEDPNEEVVRLPVEPIKARGDTATPWKGLIPLIALHAIMYETVDSLIEVLHPDPSSVNRAELYDEKKKGYVYMLKTYADRLAKTVRGGRVRSGHHAGEVTDDDHLAVWLFIEPLAEKDYPDEQIRAQIEKEYPSLGKMYTVDDITRLRQLRLPPPDRTPPENLT
jgi:hypothetical protein